MIIVSEFNGKLRTPHNKFAPRLGLRAVRYKLYILRCILQNKAALQTVAKPKSADNMPVYFCAHIYPTYIYARTYNTAWRRVCACVWISPIFPFYQKLMSCINYSVALEILPYKHFWQIEIDAVQVDRRSVTSWLLGGWKLFVCMVLDTRAWAVRGNKTRYTAGLLSGIIVYSVAACRNCTRQVGDGNGWVGDCGRGPGGVVVVVGKNELHHISMYIRRKGYLMVMHIENLSMLVATTPAVFRRLSRRGGSHRASLRQLKWFLIGWVQFLSYCTLIAWYRSR